MTASCRSWYWLAVLATLLSCGPVSAGPQEGGPPPSNWLNLLINNTSAVGVFESPDGRWRAAAAIEDAVSTSTRASEGAATKAKIVADRMLLADQVRRTITSSDIYVSQPKIVQKTMLMLAEKSTRGTMDGSWTADTRTIGQTDRGCDRVRSVAVAPVSGISVSSPRAEDLLSVIKKNASASGRLSSVLLWLELHPDRAPEGIERLAAALKGNGLENLAAAVQAKPTTEAGVPTLGADPSLVDLLRAADEDPWNPTLVLALAKKLQIEGYPHAAAILARCGTRSWSNPAAADQCSELAGTPHLTMLRAPDMQRLLELPELQRPSRARTAIKHGGYVPALIDKSATSAMPKNNLEYAISQYESTPSQATAWALLVALQTDDPAIGRALTRQAETAATLE